MNAKTVYDVAKALPKAAQKELFDMLQKEFSINSSRLRKKKLPVLSKKEAYQYLLMNVFNVNSEIKRQSYV